jgi:deazaflavin-dependent oxidoreductase (nitroreductase family)
MADDEQPDFLFGEEHVRVYRETDGEEGYDWLRGSKIILLTTTGRKSGEPRTTPLIHLVDDDRVIVIASNGGSSTHPAWFLNMQENPRAEVQLKADKWEVEPVILEGEERERLWKAMNEEWPDYDSYQGNTDRQIPVVALQRV